MTTAHSSDVPTDVFAIRLTKDTFKLASSKSNANAGTGVTFVSLGSGNYGDVNYLFMDDICGENKEIPRHAFSLAKIYKLRDKIYREKVKAVHKFNKMAKSTKFVSSGNIVKINNSELKKLKKKAKILS